MRVWKAGGEIRGWDHGLAVARTRRGGDEGAMRVRAVSEGRSDAQQARGQMGRNGELALGCGRRARAGPRAGKEGVGRCGRERRERTGLGRWAAGKGRWAARFGMGRREVGHGPV